jgi:hypothetical protein
MMKTAKASAQSGEALSELQRQALQCLEGARAEGVTQSAYARARGWDLRGVYDALARLRRTGRAPAAAAARSKGANGTNGQRRVPLRFAQIAVMDRAATAAPRSPPPLALTLRWVLRPGRAVEIEVQAADRLGDVLRELERVSA